MTSKAPEPEDKKHARMQATTADARRLFNLPETEHVIQDYHCSLWRTAVYVEGHMWITENYIGFNSGLPAITEKIAFSKVKDIKKYSPALVLSTGIKVELDSGAALSFASLFNRDEAFELLYYLFKHPVNVIKLKRDEPLPAGGSGAGLAARVVDAVSSAGSGLFSSASAPAAGGGRAFGGGSTYAIDPAAEQAGAWGGGQAQQQVAVNVQSSSQAVRTAYEIRQMGADVLDEMSVQAEQIDRIENEVENIHSKLDKADRHLRGIESLPGAFMNYATDPKKVGGGVAFEYKDRTVGWDRKKMDDINVDILYKQDNDKLIAATLTFGHDAWRITTPSGKLVHKNATGGYDDAFSKLVLRARPYHIDLRFKDPKRPRLRLMCSLHQIVTNEFVLRTEPTIEVVFEIGVDKFDYGHVALSKARFARAERGAGKVQAEIGGTSLGRSGALVADVPTDPFSASNLVSDPTAKAQLRQQERDLDEVSNVLDDLHGMAVAIGNEADRSAAQLARVNDRVDAASDRMQYQNGRVQRML